MAKEVSGYPELYPPGNGDSSGWEEALKKFNSRNHQDQAFTFGENDVSKRQIFASRLVEILLAFAAGEKSLVLLEECLAALVVMSRDPMSMRGSFISREAWEALTQFAGLKKNRDTLVPYGISVAILSCKCLSNIIFLTKDSSGHCNDDAVIASIGDRLAKFSLEGSIDIELEFLILRLLFLISIFNVEARMKILESHNGRRLLVDFVAKQLKVCQAVNVKSPCVRALISVKGARSCSEAFKTLFNLNIKEHIEETQLWEENVVAEFKRLTELCRKFLLINVESDILATEKLHNDVQNCLYSVPTSCFSESCLVPLLKEQPKDDMFSYQGPDLPMLEERDLSAVFCILTSVEQKIKASKISTENLQPVLSLLSHLSRNSRIVRKYCKTHVIPPRKDFVHRPEVGPEFRNKLIKLFTNANTEVKTAAEDFVFVLCKEKVDRLIKYAGYGNSAGLLVNRGLLAGGRGSTVYSDTDSDSDTEEYLENAEKINPITGHIPPDMPNPMDGMSDEQKEYLAVQLANQLAKLSDDNVIKPVCVDPSTGNLVSFQQRVHETVLPEEKHSEDDSD